MQSILRSEINHLKQQDPDNVASARLAAYLTAQLRWERLQKVLGHPLRGSTKFIYQKFIDEGDILDVPKVSKELKQTSPMCLGRYVFIYAQANPDVKIVWKKIDRYGIHDQWERNLRAALSTSKMPSQKVFEWRSKSFTLDSSKRLNYL
jgi:hypothetical protein